MTCQEELVTGAVGALVVGAVGAVLSPDAGSLVVVGFSGSATGCS